MPARGRPDIGSEQVSSKLVPSIKNWLTSTRLPLARQIAQIGRTARRVRRLGQTERQLDDLRVLCDQLRAHCTDLQAHCAALDRRFAGLEGVQERLASMGRQFAQTDGLQVRLASLERIVPEISQMRTVVDEQIIEQLDLAKSAQEIPRGWFQEFLQWRQDNPPPTRPLVSICVATYNRARLLTERCVASLLRQTWTNIEIIVVGDCCTDDTGERLAAIGDSRIRFVNLPQRGNYPVETNRRWQVAGSIPMNHALALCNGYFISHLDDDDEHDPNRIEKLVAFAIQRDLDFVWHPFWVESKHGKWDLLPCDFFRLGNVTTSSIFYRSWLTRIQWDVNAHLLSEPGDWNRLRKFKYLGVKSDRYPDPLLRHYAERSQAKA